jgi:long-subunit fatty acid transport protein
MTGSLEHGEQPDIKVPQKFGVGISAQTNKFRVGFDYEWKNWSTINFRHPTLETKNSNRYSVGMEYSHGTLFYRLGAHYRNSYLEIDNTQINSSGISGGVGIPFSTASCLNLSVEYGEEGTLNKGLIKNSYWMLYVSVSFRELWISLTDDD